MFRSLVVATLTTSLVLTPGCLYRETGRVPLPPRIETGASRLAGADFAGAVSVDDRGVVRVRLAMRGRCDAPRTSYDQTRVSETKSPGYLVANLTTSGLVAYGSVAGGVALTVKGYDEGIPLLVLAGVNLANILRVTVFTPRSRSKTRSKRRGEQVTHSACSDALAEHALDRTPPELVLTTPWGAAAKARVEHREAVFAVDWSRSGIDPLTAEATAQIQQPWRVTASDGSGELTWSPDATNAENALTAIGHATGTELTAEVGEAPPLLDIDGLDTKGPLPAGRTAPTSLTITNRGRGGAYRVVAITKSSDPALHGLRYSFGKIGPGESITKHLQVTVPRDHEDGKALVVITVTEANGNVPDRHSQEIDIAHAGRPRLDVTCTVAQGTSKVNETATVDAGRQLRVHCTVFNRGDGPAVAAQVDAALGASSPRASTTTDIKAGGSAVFDVLLQVPADAKTGQALPLRAEAHETDFGSRATWDLPLEIGLMQICQPPIQRDAYQRKLAEVRAMGLDAATLRAYEEQLVACLGD